MIAHANPYMPAKVTFSQYFNLGKSQFELDFVDVPVNNGDIGLFIDPYNFRFEKTHGQWTATISS